jgi:hypothetical protein
MRNPRLRRNISLAALVAGVAYLVGVFGVLKITPAEEGLFGGAIAAFIGSILAIVGIIAYHVTLQRQRRLLRGERLLARWTVLPDEWKRFRENERKRASGGKDNTIKVRADHDVNGINVVVTEESLMVDDDFYHLGDMRGLEWFPEAPPCLDFTMVTSTKGASVRWHLRFPTAAGAEPGARVIWDYVQKRLAPVDKRHQIPRWRAARWISLVVALGSALALVYARTHFDEVATQKSVIVALIGGVFGLPLGLSISAIAHWWLKRGPGRVTESAAVEAGGSPS